MTVTRALLCALAITSIGLVGACGDEVTEVEEAAGPYLAAGVGVESAYVYQVTEMPLLQSGQVVTNRTVPIIQFRDTRVRVIVRAAENTEARTVSARVHIAGVLGTTKAADIELVPGDITEVDIDVPGMAITADAAIAIAIYEVDDIKRNGDTSVARWPRDTSMRLDARDPGPLRITIVPIQPNTLMGGSFDVGPEQLAEIETDVLAQMPLSRVELTVREPVRWPDDLTAFSSWNQLVLLLANLREQDGANPDEYYYGMIPWNPNLALGGLAATLSDTPFWRVSIGVRGSRSNVMLHEMGHVLGRRHTPCGDPGGPDPFYPYDNAILNNTGYDYVSADFVNGTTTFDFMSYCQPVWTSDYTYTAIFKEVRALNDSLAAPYSPATRQPVYAYGLHDGTIKDVGRHTVVMPPATRVTIDGVAEDVGIVTFHDSPSRLLLTAEPLAPGSVVRSDDLGTFKLVGGVR